MEVDKKQNASRDPCGAGESGRATLEDGDSNWRDCKGTYVSNKQININQSAKFFMEKSDR